MIQQNIISYKNGQSYLIFWFIIQIVSTNVRISDHDIYLYFLISEFLSNSFFFCLLYLLEQNIDLLKKCIPIEFSLVLNWEY